MEKTKTVGRMTAALEQGLLRPVLSLTAAGDPAASRRFLELLRVPEAGCTELPVLRAALDRQGNIHCAENVGLNQGGSTLADPTHRSLVTDVVRTLARRYSDSSVAIDTATVNPARLSGLPGMRKAKGSPRPERPWRLATLDGIGPHPVASRCGDPQAEAQVMARSVRIHLAGTSGIPGPASLQANPWPRRWMRFHKRCSPPRTTR